MNLPSKGPYLTKGLSPGPKAIAALEQTYNIFDSEGLKAHPFNCIIPNIPPIAGWEPSGRPGFVVKVTGRLDENSLQSSYRMITDEVDILVDGRSIGVMGLNPYGITLGPDTIEIAPDGVGLVAGVCAVANFRN